MLSRTTFPATSPKYITERVSIEPFHLLRFVHCITVSFPRACEPVPLIVIFAPPLKCTSSRYVPGATSIVKSPVFDPIARSAPCTVRKSAVEISLESTVIVEPAVFAVRIVKLQDGSSLFRAKPSKSFPLSFAVITFFGIATKYVFPDSRIP